MAKQIKVLKCPQCGNTRPNSIGKEHYRCDKCQTEFFLDNDDININVNHRHDRTGNSTPVVNKGVWVAGVILFFLAVITLPILKSVTKGVKTATRNHTTATSIPPESGKYLFSMPIAAKGKGVALSVERKKLADSVYAVFRDIATGDVLNRQPLVDKKEANGISHRYFISDGSDYLIIGKNKIFRIEPSRYTLTDFSTDMCAKKPALEAGFMTAEFVPEANGEGFKLHTNLGKELYYFPASDVLCTENAFQYMTTEKPLDSAVPATYYLFLNKESAHSSNVAELLEINYLFNAGGPENKLMTASAGSLKNASKHRIRSYRPITEERIYFSPAVLYSDKEHVLISYRPSLANDAGTNVELLSTSDGKILWKKPFDKELRIRSAISVSEGFMLQTGEDKYMLISRDGKTDRTYKTP